MTLWARRYGLLCLTVAAASVAYSRTALSPLQETMRAALSLTDNQVGLLQGAALALPMILAAVPIGLLIDRASRVRLLFIFAAINLLGSLVTALAVDLPTLFLARCVIGLMVGSTTATAFSLAADLFPPEQRGRAGTVLTVGQYVGGAAAFALGGILLALFSDGQNTWRWAMFGLSLPLLLALMLIPGMSDTQRQNCPSKTASSRESLAALWCHRAVVAPLLGGLVLAEVAFLPVLTWAAPAFSRAFALSSDRLGAIIALSLLVSGVLGPVVGGVLADVCQRRGGPRLTVRALSVLALISVPAALFAVMPTLALASALLVIFVALAGAIGIITTTLFVIVIPHELRGLCISIASAAVALFGVGLAPLAVSMLAGTLGGPSMIGKALAVICVSASALCVVMFAVGSRKMPKVVTR